MVKMKGNVRALTAVSFRDTVRKTVQMLTRGQVEVQFRGFQPCVHTKGDKVLRMVLPEINDDAPEELVAAMQGFLDHECGHIFFTPFGVAEKFGGGRGLKHVMQNIIEDIRLEKLLPRELPGTKDNLERMYEAVMDKFFGKHIQAGLARGASRDEMMSLCIVVGFRALSGQKAFAAYMDKHNLWQWLEPIMTRVPTLGKELQNLETYDDVMRTVDLVLAALPKPQKDKLDNAAKKQAEEDQKDQQNDPQPSDDGDAGDESDPDPDQDEGDEGDQSDDGDKPSEDEGDSGDDGDDEGNSSEGDEADEGDKGEGDPTGEDGEDEGAGDESDDGDETDEDGGKGHGDGDGEDDGSDEEGGDCNSDGDEGEDDGAGDGDGEETDEEGEGSGGGKTNRTITDAIKQLDPTRRKVLYMHKRKRLSTEQIAQKMDMTEDQVIETLREARRKVAEFMAGDD